MRIHIVFLILLILLCLARTADMLIAIGHIQLAVAMESLFQEPNKVTTDDQPKLAALEKQKKEFIEDAVQAGIEFLMLGGICYCFFRVWRTEKPETCRPS